MAKPDQASPSPAGCRTLSEDPSKTHTIVARNANDTSTHNSAGDTNVTMSYTSSNMNHDMPNASINNASTIASNAIGTTKSISNNVTITGNNSSITNLTTNFNSNGGITSFPRSDVIRSTNLSLSRMNSTQELLTKLPLKDKSIAMNSNLSNNCSLTLFPKLNSSVPTMLKHQPSKLDLIDDTTLTSLPFPPPPKMRNRSSTSSSNTLSTQRTLGGLGIALPGEEKENLLNDVAKPSLSAESNPSITNDRNEANTVFSEQFDINSIVALAKCEFEDEYEEYDYDEDESQDPIVLVEDYMYSRNVAETSLLSSPMLASVSFPQEQARINKKKSLATFKQRINSATLHRPPDIAAIDVDLDVDIGFKTETTSMSGASSLAPGSNELAKRATNKRAISNDNTIVKPNAARTENLEEIFGKIPGSDLLKYCDLCEKPLYEISSIINNNKKFKASSNSTAKINRLYTEFICWECVETYEDFFNELYENELAIDSLPQESANVRLLEIFRSIQTKYDQQRPYISKLANFSFLNPARKLSGKSSTFSEGLMNQLDYLRNAAEETPKKPPIDLDWIKNLQYKIRWWRSSTSPTNK